MAGVLSAFKGIASDLLGISKDGDSMPAQLLRKHIPVCMLFFIGLIFYNYGGESISTTDIGDNKAPLSGGLAHGICWSKGGYLYRELLEPRNINLSGLGVGTPKNLKHSGFLISHRDLPKTESSLCQATDEDGKPINADTCDPWHIIYYRQHHWLYQVLSAIVIVMALPWVLDYFNSDRMSMQDYMKTFEVGSLDLLLLIKYKYFSQTGWCNTSTMRMIGTLIGKVIPLVLGILMLHYLDRAFEGRFMTYIPELYDWLMTETKITNNAELARIQNLQTPGDYLLPSIMLCDIFYSAYGDDANSVIYMRVQMEMNSNKTAQYWLVFVCPLMIGYCVVAGIDILLFLFKWLVVVLKSIFARMPMLSGRYGSPLYEQLTARQVYLLKSLRWSNREFAARLEKVLMADLTGVELNDITLEDIVCKAKR